LARRSRYARSVAPSHLTRHAAIGLGDNGRENAAKGRLPGLKGLIRGVEPREGWTYTPAGWVEGALNASVRWREGWVHPFRIAKAARGCVTAPTLERCAKGKELERFYSAGEPVPVLGPA